MTRLQPVSRATTAQACADQLRSAILSGDYAVGTRLPAERTLASQLGVTRVTLRTALTELSVQGLVEQVQGRGTTVLDFRQSASLDLLADLGRLSSEDPITVARDLLHVRRNLARTVLERLAVVQPDPTPVADAIARFTRVAERPDTTEEQLAQADLVIVAALLDAADSTVLSMCFHPVAHALSVHPSLRAAMFTDPSTNVVGWNALLAWLHAPSADVLPGIVALLEARDTHTLAQLEARP
jgi:GntR family transcriptional repressor for pyruvate dehydrogenase complex